MTKNKIISEWIGVTNPHWVKLISYEVLNEAWVRFRDLRFEDTKHEMYHSQFCEVIRRAITDKTMTQAFDELVKGIEWYQSLKK